MSKSMEVVYFGQFHIVIQSNEQRAQLPKPATSKSLSLLAYLIYHRYQAHTRDKLTNMFWGERPQNRARRSLSTSLTHIRRCFPDNTYIQADNRQVQFVSYHGLHLDAEAFISEITHPNESSLRNAIERYQGDFLPGFYDDWIVEERHRLQMLYAEGLSKLMIIYEENAHYEAALQVGNQLLKLDNLREDAYRLLMRSYCQLGQRNAALSLYKTCADILLAELAIEPAAETTDLYHAIRNDRFVINPQGPSEVMIPPSTTVSQPQVGYDPLGIAPLHLLIGREQELEFLHSCWQKALNGSLKTVFVDGEAGIGKSHLTETFIQQLRDQDIQVLWGNCFEFERVLPYQPIIEAIRQGLKNHKDHLQLPDWVATEVAWLLPDLFGRQAPVDFSANHQFSTSEKSADIQAQARLFHAVTYLISALAYRPSAIVLEDLHWATESTLQIIHYLTRHLTGQPILFLCTHRHDLAEPNHPLFRLRFQLNEEGLARQLSLHRLSQAAVENLITEMSMAAEKIQPLAHRLYLETDGNPFFLMEMIKTLFENGSLHLHNGSWHGHFNQISQGQLQLSNGVRETILNRVRRLSENDQNILRHAAMLGREFDFELLSHICQQGEESVLTALDHLLRHHIIREGEGNLERDYLFVHHKIQEVIYETVPRRWREFTHRIIGKAIEALFSYDLESWIGELAFHYQNGHQWEKAQFWSERAGDYARGQYALNEAIGHFTAALKHGQQLRPTISDEHELRLRQKRAQVRMLIGQLEDAQNDLFHALQLEIAADHRSRPRLLLDLAECHFLMGDFPESVKLAQQVQLLAQTHQYTSAVARFYLGRGLHHMGQNREAVMHIQEALAQFERAGTIEDQGWAHLTLASIYQGAFRELLAATNHLNDADSFFALSDHIPGQILVSHTRANLAVQNRDLQGFVELHEHTLRKARQVGYAHQETISLAHLALGYIRLGQYAVARQYATKSLNASRRQGATYWEGAARLYLVQIDIETDNLASAQDTLYRLNEMAMSVGNHNGLALINTHLARLHLKLDAPESDQSAYHHAQEAFNYARLAGNPREQTLALSLQGLAALAIEDPHSALHLSNKAVTMATKGLAEIRTSEIYFNHFRILDNYGQHINADQHSEARFWLQSAYDERNSLATKIQKADFKRSFLKNIRLNREIIASYVTIFGGPN